MPRSAAGRHQHLRFTIYDLRALWEHQVLWQLGSGRLNRTGETPVPLCHS